MFNIKVIKAQTHPFYRKILVQWCLCIIGVIGIFLCVGVSLVSAQDVQPPDQAPMTADDAPTTDPTQQMNVDNQTMLIDPTLTTGMTLTASDLGSSPDTRALTLLAAGAGAVAGAGLLTRGGATNTQTTPSAQVYRTQYTPPEDDTPTTQDGVLLAQTADDAADDPALGGTAASIGADLTPIVGEIKGFIEVFTGRDLITGEELGHWRWAGLAGIVGLNEIRLLRYGDDAVDAVRFGGRALNHVGDVADQLRAGASVTDLLRAGVAPSDLIRAGASADDLINAGRPLRNTEWRQLIDNPPPGRTADDMRYQRYRQTALEEGRTPSARTRWDEQNARLRENNARGRLSEDQALESVGVNNNNYGTTPSGQPRDVVRYDTTIDGRPISVRPDGVSSSHWIDVKSTTGTQYYTEQLRAQAQGAQEAGRRLAVVLTNSGEAVRPSGPLSDAADVFFRNSDTGNWARWNARANNGQGGWVNVTAEQAQRMLGGGTP
ncbi:MAG: hypothetical protein GFH27_549293n106 [Chloroflexi bacterium AL-W]|nr:hypothetical protein [Chloroflexi bacterium AL-N1]NOK67779.1 hypothetical protein [Chloroflexi bacterium AL-N10]NOK75451.1 hypothetical protein [Chloroflexi bacterium AL-N5]NOK82239.1 hypothetical protein [Chloroflexi bacterium AL-W]NOK90084.1 hypothetical protein [Chloroflexi bacterium AL-N15]